MDEHSRIMQQIELLHRMALQQNRILGILMRQLVLPADDVLSDISDIEGEINRILWDYSELKYRR